MKNALVIFIKNPEPGKVKTRLAKTVGFEVAADMYKNLVEKNMAEVKPLHQIVCDCWIAYDPPNAEISMRQWLSEDYYYLPQQGEGLTDRILNVINDLFKREYSSVAILGSDTLNLRKELIDQCFQMLKLHDIVIGPARDGGYYLIALKSINISVFEGITWSTDKVLEETIHRINKENLTYHLIETLDDMDEIRPGVTL